MAGATIPVFGLVLPGGQPEWATRAAEAWPSLIAVPLWTGSPGPDVIVRPIAVESARWGLGQWVIACWAIGTVAFLARLARDVARLAMLVGPAVPLRDRACLETC